MSVFCASWWASSGRVVSHGADPLAPWRKGLKISAVVPDAGRHTVHANHLTSPESPDGRWVLIYSSTTSEGHDGDIRIVERSTGRVKVLATNVTVEDIHRVACQQWISGGQRVVFHDLRDAQWVVVSVDINTLQERVLARGRQLGWGQVPTDLVPLYGPPWGPGEHRDLELLNVQTGAILTVVTAQEVKRAYPGWVAEAFSNRPLSIFFPVLSPDGSRVFFKMATPAGGDLHSHRASDRKGLLCYDLKHSRFTHIQGYYGHPTWHSDSLTLVWSSVHPGGHVLINSDTGSIQGIPKLPAFPGSHPAVSPDGGLLTTDTQLEPFGGPKNDWGVVVGDIREGDWRFVYKFDNARGATSWRHSHPHPCFSPDGKRLYFNVNATGWTQLYLAECGK